VIVPIPDNPWRFIDDLIFANKKTSAIKEIRAMTCGGIVEALQILTDRYNKLRTEAPDRFNCSHEEYWSGFYS
jgi:hypothetical protein